MMDGRLGGYLLFNVLGLLFNLWLQDMIMSNRKENRYIMFRLCAAVLYSDEVAMCVCELQYLV